MIRAVYNITLDLLTGGSQASIRLKKGEAGARRLAIRLSCGSKPYTPDSNTQIQFRAIKPDDTHIYNSTEIDGSIVLVDITTQTVAAAGTLHCELSLTDTSSNLMYSPQFDIVVEDYLYSDSGVESSDEYGELADLIASVPYTFVKYSDAEPTSDGDMKDTPAAWLGIYVGTSRTAPTAYTDYQWQCVVGSGIKGEQGDKGDKGDPGAKGDPGERGPAGPSGPAGVQGPAGPKGDKGDAGTGLQLKGTYATVAALQASVLSPSVGDMYNVGTSAPFNIYMWNGTAWEDQGQLQGADGTPGADGAPGAPGAKGDPGADGTTFTPSVSESGDLSWSNDGAKSNPATVNIKGPQGPAGTPGAAGATGPAGPNEISTTTETAINGLIKGNGSNAAQAVPGTDYATPATDLTATLTTSWTGSSAPYTQTVSGLTGVTANSKLDIGLAEDATDAQYAEAVAAQIRATGSGAGTVTFKAHGTKPTVALPIIVRVVS